VALGDLVADTRLPAVARAHAAHLLWHRRLAVDLGRPLGDSRRLSALHTLATLGAAGLADVLAELVV